MRLHHRQYAARLRAAATLLCATLLAGGCINFGPRAIEAGRADYNGVLRRPALLPRGHGGHDAILVQPATVGRGRIGPEHD